MTLPPSEFMRRFLIHVLPSGFHSIRHYGLFANGNRAANLARARKLLASPPQAGDDQILDKPSKTSDNTYPWSCPCCGGRMVIIETFEPGGIPPHPPQRAPPKTPSVSP